MSIGRMIYDNHSIPINEFKYLANKSKGTDSKLRNIYSGILFVF